MAGSDDVKFEHIFTAKNPGRIEDFYRIDRRKLGEGSYGKVFIAEKKQKDGDGPVRAVKAIDISKIKDKSRFQQEIDIQQHMDHPNIVKLYETFQDAKRVYLVMELCTGGELFDRIVEATTEHEGTAFSEKDAAKYMSQILGAVRYFHSKNFVHRDIKPENFLMQNKTKTAEIKVIDFGLARNFDISNPKEELMMTKAGTPYYVAPQVLLGKGYNEKCDIWSCGVICYILLCGYPPFNGDTDNEILKAVKKGSFDFPDIDWARATADVKDFITKMLTFDAAQRPSAEELLLHDWLKPANAAAAEVVIGADLAMNMKKFRSASKLKKVAVTMIAQSLKDSEIQALRETFIALDNNKDGSLTQKEILDGLKKHNIPMPDDFMQILEGLDTDGSGSIDYSEFIASSLSARMYMKKSVAWDAFRMFDRDNDGVISKDELNQVFNDIEVSEQIMKEVDLDKGGTISFDEFWEMLQRDGI
mmetsp:Transcript_26093/g.75310  ORF Transcript_26093/g.75310 Transcript_26093/m.75310 type:complete len:474 (-) Transcript_26093:156-1577(-)